MLVYKFAQCHACESGGEPSAEDVGDEDRLADGAAAAAASAAQAAERILQAPTLRIGH